MYLFHPEARGPAKVLKAMDLVYSEENTDNVSLMQVHRTRTGSYIACDGLGGPVPTYKYCIPPI